MLTENGGGRHEDVNFVKKGLLPCLFENDTQSKVNGPALRG
jgi:hypothetical protein